MIPDRKSPDRDIELLDRTASRAQMARDSGPPELMQLRDRISESTMRQDVLAHSTEPADRTQLAQLRAEHPALEAAHAALLQQRSAERKTAATLVEAREAHANALNEADSAPESAGAAHATVARTAAAHAAAASALAAVRGDHPPMVPTEITPVMVMDELHRWTGQPMDKIEAYPGRDALPAKAPFGLAGTAKAPAVGT